MVRTYYMLSSMSTSQDKTSIYLTKNPTRLKMPWHDEVCLSALPARAFTVVCNILCSILCFYKGVSDRMVKCRSLLCFYVSRKQLLHSCVITHQHSIMNCNPYTVFCLCTYSIQPRMILIWVPSSSQMWSTGTVTTANPKDIFNVLFNWLFKDFLI